MAIDGCLRSLRRKAVAVGCPPPSHKRVYRVMKEHGLLVQRHAGGAERRHDGTIAVEQSDPRPWRSADRRCLAGGSSACRG